MRFEPSPNVINLSRGAQSLAMTLLVGGGAFHIEKEPRCVS